MIQAASKRREWDSAPPNPDDPRAPVGVDPVLPAQRHEVPGTIWWERRSYVEGMQVSYPLLQCCDVTTNMHPCQCLFRGVI